MNAELKQIRIDKLTLSPTNTRYNGNGMPEADQNSLNELSKDIVQNGMIEPLIVMPKGKGYEIVCGERRYRASKLADLKFVPCIIRTDITNPLAIQVAENLHREDLNPIDEAIAFRAYFKKGEPDIEALAEATSKTKPYILRRVRLTELEEDIKKMIASGQLTANHGLELLRLPDKVSRKKLAKFAVKEGLNSAEVRRQIDGESWSANYLKNALFDIKDEDAKPRSCVGCAFHGRHQKEMFGEMELLDSGNIEDDRCFDSRCYDIKNWAIIKLIGKRTDAKVIFEEGDRYRKHEHSENSYGTEICDYYATGSEYKKMLKFVYGNETATILIRHTKKSAHSMTVFTSDKVALKKEFPNFGLDSYEIQQRADKEKARKQKVKEAEAGGEDLQREETAEKEITRFKLYADIDRREFMIDSIGKSKPSGEILRLNTVRLALCQSIDYSLAHSASFFIAIGEALPDGHELKKGFERKIIERVGELAELTSPFGYHTLADGEYGERVTDKERAEFQKEFDKLPALPSFHSNSEIWKFTEGMSEKLVITLLGVASERHLIGIEDAPQHEYASRKGYSTQMLENISDTLNIDRRADMALTDEFLKAQTKNRLLQIAWELGVFDVTANLSMRERLENYRKILKGKKGEVIDAIKEVALKGNSPAGYATGELDREVDKGVEKKYNKFLEKLKARGAKIKAQDEEFKKVDKMTSDELTAHMKKKAEERDKAKRDKAKKA